MNKTIILFVLSIFTFGSLTAQDNNEPPTSLTRDASDNLMYEKVYEYPGVSQKELYKRVKLWIDANLKTIDNNISFDDLNNENISTSDVLLLNQFGAQSYRPCTNFKINFSFKEGKFKVKATQFSYIVGVINAPLETLKGVGSAKWKRRIYIDFDEKFTALMASLQKAAGSKDNW